MRSTDRTPDQCQGTEIIEKHLSLKTALDPTSAIELQRYALHGPFLERCQRRRSADGGSLHSEMGLRVYGKQMRPHSRAVLLITPPDVTTAGSLPRHRLFLSPSDPRLCLFSD